jgi:hypothetical protein
MANYKTTRARLRRGGVSPKMRGPALTGGDLLSAVVAAAAPAGVAQPDFVNHGGPVIANPNVFTSFWGDAWTNDADHVNRVKRLNQFCQDLVNSPFMNVLTQYGVGAPGVFNNASFIGGVSGTLTDGDIQNTIQSAISNGNIPEPPAPFQTCLILYLAEGIGIEDTSDPQNPLILCEPSNDSAFGYHNFFTTTAGNKFYYAVVPALDDNCLKESCSDDGSCSLHLAETQEQRQTQVTSHEFAEMTTDPELNAWFGSNGENGDICNGEADTITVGANTWTVQRTYSKTDDMNTGGASFCLSQAANPIPPMQ